MDFKNISDLLVKYFLAIMDIVIFLTKIVVTLFINYFFFKVLKVLIGYLVVHFGLLAFIISFSVAALCIYINWAIWTQGAAKKILMVTIFMFILLCVGFITASHLDADADYCIEDGECDEGYIYKDRAISEDYCIELDGIWHTEGKVNYCKLKRY